MGERILRILQRQTPGRMPRWRDLLQPERGADRDRELAHPLQHQAAALRAWLSTTGAACAQTTTRPDARRQLTSHFAWYKISVSPRVGPAECATFLSRKKSTCVIHAIRN